MREMTETTYNAIKNRAMVGENKFNYSIEIEGFTPPSAPLHQPTTPSPGSEPFAGGSGTEEDPYLVSTADQLNEIRNYSASAFIQTGDIDLSSYANWRPIQGVWHSTGDWGGTWNSFGGVYDGNNYRILGLKINAIEEPVIDDEVGLFGVVESRENANNTVLKNIRIEDAIIISEGQTGILAGEAQAMVENCHVSGSITIPSGEGSGIGGLIGELYHFWDVPENGLQASIKGCSADVDILTHGERSNGVGGLMGMCEVPLVEKCFALGTITLTNSHTWNVLGGFVGSANEGFHGLYTNYINCYALVDVVTASEAPAVGGFAGEGYDVVHFTNCYCAGLTTATGYDERWDIYGQAFGFMGQHGWEEADMTVNSCYYDSDVSGLYDTEYGLPKTTIEMKTRGTFAGWDFDNVWALDPLINNGYPHFKKSNDPPTGYLLGVRSISISKTKGGASTATITVNNKEGLVNPRNPQSAFYKFLNTNAKIVIRQGYGEDLVTSFTGLVDGIHMSSFPQVAEISLRDNFKIALDQTVTKEGSFVVKYSKQPIESIVADLCQLCKLPIAKVEPTGISIETEFNWQTYADAFQQLSDIASFEYRVDEEGLFHFERDIQPDDFEVAWSFEEGIDTQDMAYEINDQDIYRAIRVYGTSGSDVIVYNTAFRDAEEFNILPQKIMKIDASEASTLSELTKIAKRAASTMRSRIRTIKFKAIAVPHLQVGDFIQLFETSSDTHDIFRVSSLGLTMTKDSFTMDCTGYYYGDSLVADEPTTDIADQIIAPNLNLIPNMTSNTKPSGVARSSSVYKLYGITYSPWRSFNDAEFDYFWDISTVQGWIEYEFPLRHIIDKYSVKAREDLVWNKAIPKDWAFEAFDGEKWIELDRQTGHTNWGIYEERSFNFDNTTPYAKYRLRVIANNGYKRSQLEQLKMFYRGGV